VLTTSGENLRCSPIPKIFVPKKTQRMVYAKGKSVFELIDPDGHIYVLQAHDAQFPIESLAKLGEQMKQLPKGWQYRTRALTEDLVLDLGPDKTTPSEMNSINTGVVAQTAENSVKLGFRLLQAGAILVLITLEVPLGFPRI
jgi:hypothetical protein